MKKVISILVCFSILFTLAIPIFAAVSAPPAQGAAVTGVYRNLFKEAGYTDAEVTKKVDTAWNQLFYGDDNQRIFYPVGTDMAYIYNVGDSDVRSEGMSYGMMMCVQLDKQQEFNKLWKWAKTYMYHSSGQHQGYFAWQCKTDGSKMDTTPASDGEEYFATSLLFASKRWGDGEGIYNYKKEALSLINELINHNGTKMFDTTQHQVVFCPIGSAATFTDPSYHLPAFYEVWAQYVDKDVDFWNTATSTSRSFFKKTTNPTTGLAPDYANFDGTPNTSSGDHNTFKFDAWRVASNIAVDYAWWAKEPWEKTHADTIQSFFTKQGISSYGNNFNLDGSVTSKDHSQGLVAMNAVASLAATNSTTATNFVKELWNAQIPSGKWRYYDGCLYMFGILHCSGNFKAYLPGSVGPKIGDINHDNKVDILDAMMLKKYVVHKLDKIDTDAADMNKDGTINSIDYLLLKKAVIEAQ